MEGNTEFWISHIEACRREGEAASVYARQHGLTLASLYYLRCKWTLAAAIGGANDPVNQFVVLRVVLYLCDYWLRRKRLPTAVYL